MPSLSGCRDRIGRSPCPDSRKTRTQTVWWVLWMEIAHDPDITIAYALMEHRLDAGARREAVTVDSASGSRVSSACSADGLTLRSAGVGRGRRCYARIDSRAHGC